MAQHCFKKRRYAQLLFLTPGPQSEWLSPFT